MHWPYLPIGLCLVSLAGCTEQAPWGVEGKAGFPCFPERTCDNGLTCTAGICLGDPGTGCTLDDPIALDPLPQITTREHLVIRGTVGGSAGSDATEVVASVGEKIVRIALGAERSFCADLPLLADGPTEVAVVARNEEGCVTAPQIATVTFDPNGINVVAGLIPRGLTPKVESLTDGSTSTTQIFSFNDSSDPSDGEICDTYSYLWFALDKPQSIYRMIVHYPERADFKNYLLCWSLLGSDADNPGIPLPSRNNRWSTIGQSTGGRHNDLVYDFPRLVTAKHIALLVFEDGERGATENFELAEVAFYSRPAEPPANSCE